jgi:flagellar biosynthesis/type III secretory pathway protein FliH
MLWSNGGGKPPELKRAAFADVTPGSRRPPAWVSGQKKEQNEPALPQGQAPARQAAAAGAGQKDPERSLSPNAVPRAPRLPAEAAHDRSSLRPIQVSSQPRTSLLAMEMVSPLESLRVPAPASAPIAAEPSPEMLAAFAAAIEALADARRSVLVESTSDLAKLAGMIAKRVIGREVSLDPRIVLALVQEGLDALGTYDRIRVRLGPDFESMQTELSQKLKGRGVEYEVFIDIELPPYGCVVETDLGRVDESVERRLDQLFRGLITESDTPPTV